MYANDDMFFGAPVGPEFFFTADGRPIVRLKRKSCGKLRRVIKRLTGIGFGYYRRSIFRAADQVERATGVYFSAIPHHNIDAYRRDDNRRVTEKILAASVQKMLPHRTRTEGDLQRVALSFWALATGRAELRWHKSKRESVRIGLHKPDWAAIMRRHRPRLFCLNDSQRASDDDRARVRPFLEALFPEPSAFERRD